MSSFVLFLQFVLKLCISTLFIYQIVKISLGVYWRSTTKREIQQRFQNKKKEILYIDAYLKIIESDNSELQKHWRAIHKVLTGEQ